MQGYFLALMTSVVNNKGKIVKLQSFSLRSLWIQFTKHGRTLFTLRVHVTESRCQWLKDYCQPEITITDDKVRGLTAHWHIPIGWLMRHLPHLFQVSNPMVTSTTPVWLRTLSSFNMMRLIIIFLNDQLHFPVEKRPWVCRLIDVISFYRNYCS